MNQYENGSIKAKTHVMCIFKDEETEFQYALNFLKEGLDKNELVVLINDDFPKTQILEIMEHQWKTDVGTLFKNLDIIIKAPSEIYFPRGHLDPIQIENFFQNVTQYAIEKGKTGIRVFGSTRKTFEKDLAHELLHYEKRLEKEFEIPFTAICPYQKKDIGKLNKEEFDTLKEHHFLVIEV